MILDGEPVLMFPVDAKIDAVMPDGTHHYWSTHCRHGNHEECSAAALRGTVTSINGVKGVWPGALQRIPASCKTCASPCICPCHKEATDG